MTFTPRAQQVLALARQEAVRGRHTSIGPEHLLLGFIRLSRGLSSAFLTAAGLELETARQEVLSERPAEDRETQKLVFTSRVVNIIALADEEARSLEHGQIGTEHLLLGLLRLTEGVAARVLRRYLGDANRAQREIRQQIIIHRP